jgi:hypothetical protein
VNEILNFKLEPDSSFDQLLAGNSDGLLIDDEEDEFGELRYDGGILIQDRKFMSRRCLRQKKHARYAIKTLKDECLTDPETFVGGVIDLAVECRFLAVIKHPNIIKMRGCSDGNPLSFGFFVVLDRLYATLTQKIAEWKKEDSKSKGFGKIMDMKGKKKRAMVSFASFLIGLHAIKILTWVFKAAKAAAGRRGLDTGTLLMSILLLN